MPDNTAIDGASNGAPSNLWTKLANGANGTAPKQAVQPATDDSATIWPRLQQWLPARKPDWDYWWKFSGPRLATMLHEAGYSVHEQYEAMLFHYHYVIPRLGGAPGPDGQPKWKSPLGLDGSPVEYSFKWDAATSDPDVRYTIECLGEYTGSAADPFNTEDTKDLMYQLSLRFPSIDLTWFHQLTAYVYDSHKASYNANGGTATTTMVLAFELLKTGLMVKAYFVAPKRLDKGMPAYDNAFWASAVNTLAPSSQAADKVFSFLASDPHGKALHPAGLAIDCVAPSKSRVKYYLQTADTSFASVRAIMSMGGAISGLDGHLDELYELIKAITGLPADHPETAQVPATTAEYADGLKHFDNLPELLSGYVYYFDIRPGASKPDIKFYIPTRHYASSDAQVARGLATWMRDRGRGKYVDSYGRILDSFCNHRRLEEGNGVHAFVSCAFVKGELSVTSYLGPEAYHPRRLGKGRYAKDDPMDYI